MNKHSSNLTGKTLVLSSVVALGVSWTPPAHALCSHAQQDVFISDQSVFDLRACRSSYDDWFWSNMQIDKDDWRNRLGGRVPVDGPGTFCELTSEYPKVVSAGWLVASMPHIPTGSPPLFLVPFRAFHGHDDYGPIIDGNDTEWHDALKYTPIDGYGGNVSGGLTFGAFQPHPIAINEIQSYCTVYDWEEPFFLPGGAPPGGCGVAGGCIGTVKPANGDDVATRATLLVHEGWHAWAEENLTSDFASTLGKTGHEFDGAAAVAKIIKPGQANFCSNGVECDHFRPHVNTFQEGALIDAGRTTDAVNGAFIVPRPSTFHSVYQTEIEFDCDLADYGASFVPFSVRELAAVGAKIASTTSVIEGVPFFCGSTRPFWTKDPGALQTNGPPPCLDQNRTDCGPSTNGNCGANRAGGCGPDGCCIPTCADQTQQCRGVNASSLSCGTQCNIATGCCEPPVTVN